MQTHKKGDALVAELDSLGHIANVSLLKDTEVQALRNIAPDNHKSFPGFNLNCPLFVNQGVAWNDFEEQWKAAHSSSRGMDLAYDKKDLKRLNRLVHEFPQQEIAPRLTTSHPKLQSLLAVLERLGLSNQTPEEFLRELATRVIEAGEEARLPRQAALWILFGKPNRKQQRLEQWKTTLIFDVVDLKDFPYRVADPAVGREVSSILLLSEAEAKSKPGSAVFSCSLTGRADDPVGEKMPQPNLPILGPSYLMSMNADIPCQIRYGQTSTAIFPVGRSTALDLNNSVLFITDQARRNSTWAGVPNGPHDTGDLLIAFLEDSPDEIIPITSLFTDDDSDGIQNLATFEKRVEAVFQALTARKKLIADTRIRVVAISRIDKGRRQVILSDSFSAAAIFQAHRNWASGVHNVPEVLIPFPTAKGKAPEWLRNEVPSPSQVMISFKSQWIRAGRAAKQGEIRKRDEITRQAVPGVELRRIYDLLLKPDATYEARALLDRYVPLIMPLLVGLARSLRGGQYLSEAARKEALVAVSIFGILLFRQGVMKEEYMENREFLLGQFFQFADLLHRLYCESERDNSIPPQLIGNAVLPMATQSPVRAFDVLSNRLPVYWAWAERTKGDKAGLAKWTRKELGRIAGLLKEQNLAPAIDANGKAQLLLGYLAKYKGPEGDN